jgi:Cof subfamily protein (haloacid dehalogenase superfamily)
MTQNNRKHDIRMIVLDVDGTLLNSEHALTARTAEAIKAAIAKDIHVVLATGKTRNSTTKLIDELGIRSPGIYLQGLAIYDEDGTIQHQWTLDPQLARQVITFAEDRGFTMVGFSESRILVRADDPQMKIGFSNYHELAPEIVGPLQNVLGNTALNKLIAMGEPRAIKALRWQLSAQIGGAGRLMQAGVPWMVEILPPGGSKATALKQLLKDMKIKPENVLAAGDAENDIEMIQLAGVGVAMGQAAQDVKDAADYVTASNDEDGVGQAIERFVLTAAETEIAEEKAEDEPEAVVIEPAPAEEEAEAEDGA